MYVAYRSHYISARTVWIHKGISKALDICWPEQIQCRAATMTGGWSTCSVRRGWGDAVVQPREEVFLGCLNNILQCLRGGHPEDKDRLFTVGHGWKTTGMCWNNERLRFYIKRNVLTVTGVKCWKKVRREAMQSLLILEGFQDHSG